MRVRESNPCARHMKPGRAPAHPQWSEVSSIPGPGIEPGAPAL
jgi:hypothetical protein